MTLRPLTKGWDAHLDELARAAATNFIILSPFVTTLGVSRILDALGDDVSVHVVTDLSPRILARATDPKAVRMLSDRANVTIHHLRGLHAKVYIADRHAAIVTSANLTRGGIETNYEFGVPIQGSGDVAPIAAAADSYLNLAILVDATILRAYLNEVENAAVPTPQPVIPREVTQAYQQMFPARGRGTRTSRTSPTSAAPTQSMLRRVFAPSILAEIALNGPQNVEHLYATIREQYPELCDDAITRGTPQRALWKHEVRFALEELKEERRVQRVTPSDSKMGKWAALAGAASPP